MTTSTISQEQHQKVVGELQAKIDSLQEQLKWFQRQIFGQRSEKFISNDEQFYLEGLKNLKSSEPPKIQTVPAHNRKVPQRNGQDKISWPSDLPVEREIIDLPEDQKTCKETGCALVKIGEETTSKLALKPGKYYIKEIVRPKYAHPQKSEEGIFISELPGLLTRCQAEESLLADILVKKFADHLPLNRISEIMAREKVIICRQVLASWVMRSAEALKPLYNEMAKRILDSENIFIDETPIKMLAPGKGKTHQAYMWVMNGGKEANPPYRIYYFKTSHEHHHAMQLLKNYHGVLHSDKFRAYETLAKTKQFTWCPCWVHIRRKFIEAEHGDPPFRNMVLEKIQSLFELEKQAWLLSPEERLQIRQEKEIPIIDELTESIKDRLVKGAAILPKSKFKEALGYYCGLIPYLKNYTNHPWARLDNNVAERAVRPLAIGRKNWLFVGNEGGGEAAATLYSLIQSCRAININPKEYLEDVMRRLMSHNSQKLYELLPNHWAKARGLNHS